MIKKTKNRVIAAVLSIVILFLFFSMCSCSDSVLETDDISNYNSERYPLLETIFLEELPSNAEVIEFTYYKYYTGKEWSDARNYDICLDSGKLGYRGCVEAIKQQIKLRFGEE